MADSKGDIIKSTKSQMGHKADGIKAHTKSSSRKAGPLGEVISKLKK